MVAHTVESGHPCFIRMCTLRHDYPRLLSELRPWIQLLSLLLATNIMYRYIIVFGGREGNGSGGRPCPPGYLYFKQSVYEHNQSWYISFIPRLSYNANDSWRPGTRPAITLSTRWGWMRLGSCYIVLFSFHEYRGEPFVSNSLIPVGLGTRLEMRLAWDEACYVCLGDRSALGGR